MKLPRLYPPLWFLLFAVTAIGFSEIMPMSVELGRVSEIPAMLGAITGGVLALWARGLFRKASTTAHPFDEASSLVTRGAYRISRNPMYLGLLLALTALVIWLQNLSGLVLPPLFVLLINRCYILPEEQRLSAQFGETYLNYLNRTRRWI
ncbi:MAG: isoprenylcysteine carboxylmethyltransferase family protein [Pseudomonadota bacterium]